MKHALVIIHYHRDHLNIRRDWKNPIRWLCFWRGHKYTGKLATLSYELDGRQVKGMVSLPGCRICGRLLDYSINIGSADRSVKVSGAKVTV